MLPTEHVLAFALITLILVAIPGPSVLFTVGRALGVGRRAALLTAAGNAAGTYVQVIAVALGLGALVASSITAFTVVKLAGAASLIYLGVQAIRHRRVLPAATADARITRSSKVLREGFVVGVTNPKEDRVPGRGSAPDDRPQCRAGSRPDADPRRRGARDCPDLRQCVGCRRWHSANMVR